MKKIIGLSTAGLLSLGMAFSLVALNGQPAKEVKAAQKAQATAEKKLAELQAKYEALEAEANAKIAELSKGAE